MVTWCVEVTWCVKVVSRAEERAVEKAGGVELEPEAAVTVEVLVPVIIVVCLVMIVVEIDGAAEVEVDTDTLVKELLGETEDEMDTSTLLTELSGGAEESPDDVRLLTKLTTTDAALDATGGAVVDELADDGVETLLAAALEVDMVGMGSAEMGFAIASAQARMEMEYLRLSCMVMDGCLRYNGRNAECEYWLASELGNETEGRRCIGCKNYLWARAIM